MRKMRTQKRTLEKSLIYAKKKVGTHRVHCINYLSNPFINRSHNSDDAGNDDRDDKNDFEKLIYLKTRQWLPMRMIGIAILAGLQ